MHREIVGWETPHRSSMHSCVMLCREYMMAASTAVGSCADDENVTI